MRFFVGIDEAGRGPLAGPIYFGGCKVAKNRQIDLLAFFHDFPFGKDSKKLSEMERRHWFGRIVAAEKRELLAFRVCSASSSDIDAKGLTAVSKKLVGNLLKNLTAPVRQTQVLLDGGLSAPPAFVHQETIIKGDEKVFLISLASIVAKVSRDRTMTTLGKRFKGYGFEQHKGYATTAHFEALRRLGLSPIHRRRFLVKWNIRNGDIH